MTLLTPQALLLLIPVALYGAYAWQKGEWRHRQGQVSLSLRILVASLLVLSLSGLALSVEEDRLSTLFVVDVSLSVGAPGEGIKGGSAAARDFVQKSLDQKPDDDQAGVILFAEKPEFESFLKSSPQSTAWTASPSSGGTHLEDALKMALAALPAHTHKRIVLLSDGVETEGDALKLTSVAQALKTPIDVLPLSGTVSPEQSPRLETLEVPPELKPGRPFEMRLSAYAPSSTRGQVRLYQGENPIGTLDVDLQKGLNSIRIPHAIQKGGLHRLRAVLDTPEDPDPRDNEARSSTYIEGQTRVLLVEGHPGAATHLHKALASTHILSLVASLDEMPLTDEEFSPWDAVVFCDVPATALRRRHMRAVQRSVQHLGRGFMMTGGENSFGVGGYFKTPIEDILPVRTTREGQKEIPSQGIALAIDRSGSMGSDGTISKIELAKEASATVVELLHPKDELGVMGFDSAATWVVPYSPLGGKKSEATRRIGTLRAGGGTDIYNALREAHKEARKGEASVKHIILVSDGISGQSNFPALLQKITDDKITVSAIAIGRDSDRFTMDQIAQLGGGRSYETDAPETLPQIFTREAMMSSRQFLVEETFTPTLAHSSEVLRSIDALPPLEGYVATSLKPRATLALQTHQKEPLLAHWRTGLGRSLAWTSDLEGRWTRAWLEDPTTTWPLFQQAVDWVSSTQRSTSLKVHHNLRGSSLRLDVRAPYDRQGTVSATLLTPRGDVLEIPLQEEGGGRFRAETRASAQGTYLLTVIQSVEGKEVGRTFREIHRTWSPEFAPSHRGTPTLKSLAARTGGRWAPRPDQIWQRPQLPLHHHRPLTDLLLLFSAILWCAHVAWRKLGPAPLETAPKNQPKTPQTPPKPPSSPPASPPQEPLPPERYTSRLLGAKKRAQRR